MTSGTRPKSGRTSPVVFREVLEADNLRKAGPVDVPGDSPRRNQTKHPPFLPQPIDPVSRSTNILDHTTVVQSTT